MADNSILAIDFGNITTRALLIDLVEGQFRVVARADERTTAGFPVNDVGVTLRRVVSKLSATTGRQLMTDEGRVISPETIDRSGVDLFVATASVGRPLRTVVIGLFPDMSIASIMRATAGTYISVVDVISAADRRSAEDRLNAIALANPDLIVIAGGTEDGARDPILEMARLTRLALRLMRRSIPPNILYAGNSALRGQIASIFEGATNVIFSENVRPSVSRENVEDARAQLAVAFDAFTEQRGMGFDEVSYQTRHGVLPTAQSYDNIIRFMGEYERGVLAIDLGSAVSTISASIGGKVSTSIRTDIGLGHRADSTLDAAGIEAVRAWLPFLAADEEILGYVLNKTLRPYTIPQLQRTLYLEHALLRAALNVLMDAARPLWSSAQMSGAMALEEGRAPLPPVQRIIGAGAGLTGTGRPGMTAMLLLDVLQPTGTVRLQADPIALIPALGALARINPTAAVQVLDGGGLEELGMAISVSGKPRRGRPAVSVSITKENGETDKFTVEGGRLHVYPLGIGVQAQVRVSVRGTGLSIGGRRGMRMKITGGTAGLVIDARGRPLPLESALKARAAQIVGWYADATGDEPFAIPDAWLTQQSQEEEITDIFDRDARQRDRVASVTGVTADTGAGGGKKKEEKKRPARERQNARQMRRGRGKSAESDDDIPMPDMLGETPAQIPEPEEDDLDDLRTLFP